ncbi:MAG: hypothetical protein HKN50_10005 [Gammaproteobacteria bacterium]|nr:hypothetical protein [Gammaproteobacteria bacterium]
MNITPIKEIQGTDLSSPLAGQMVRTRGVVTASVRRGFFLQTPAVEWDQAASDAIFIYSPDWPAIVGCELEVSGEVIDYFKHETARPVTQVHLDQVRIRKSPGPTVKPIDLTARLLPETNKDMARLLNSLEGMLLRIPAGQTFIAPSNPYGDYVLAMDGGRPDNSLLRSRHGGVIPSADSHLRWFPGFRVSNYNHAPRLNVGAKLNSDVVGPLNYRVDAYQLAVNQPFKLDPAYISIEKSALKPTAGSITIMTLNCFNLDPHIESAHKVMNPDQDVDDDWGDGRFHTLAQAVVLQANSPDIVALQEIQDNDGAELSEVVDASETYQLLIKTIEQLSGVRYQWIDVNPVMGADGGQPGGNIRNAYLYNTERVDLVPDLTRVLGSGKPCFEGSRKPLLAVFREKHSGEKLACINVHLASKRHQNSIFAPHEPGVDAKLGVRVAQAAVIHQEMQNLSKAGMLYYVTGDFNDTEHSQTLAALTLEEGSNLVCSLPPEERYDYNHRGKLQVLMHGIVPTELVLNNRAQYEIIHGNELIGVTPGEQSDKPSDHAYVIAKIQLAD